MAAGRAKELMTLCHLPLWSRGAAIDGWAVVAVAPGGDRPPNMEVTPGSPPNQAQPLALGGGAS